MATPQSSCAATGAAIRPPPTSEIATAEPRTTRESFIRDAPPLCPLAERWTNRRRSSAARRTSGPLHLKPTLKHFFGKTEEKAASAVASPPTPGPGNPALPEPRGQAANRLTVPSSARFL